MSMPPPTDACWQKLASGGISRLQTQQLALQLMSKRLERSKDPLPIKAAEVHSFFVKWERTLGSEIQQLKSI